MVRMSSNKKGSHKLRLNPNAKNFKSNESRRRNIVNAFKRQFESETVNSVKSSVNTIEDFRQQFLDDKEKVENAVALDCEMVKVGDTSVLAHIAIVDFNGKEIYNKYVIPKEGVESITNYVTEYSGVTHNNLKNLNKSHSFEHVQKEVMKIVKDKMVVGHGLINDFKVLEFVPDKVWDSAVIPEYKRMSKTGILQSRKLKNLTRTFTRRRIQTGKNGHNPAEDARASMNLYRNYFLYQVV